MIKDIYFENIEFLWLLILVPLLGFGLWFFRNKQEPFVVFSSVKGFSFQKSWRVRFYAILPIFRIFAFVLIVIALARPRITSEVTKAKTTEGIDIVLSADISTSMLAKDLKPNRLEALKSVALQFVQERKNDRIGLVVYAGESYTKVPVTSDKKIIQKAITELNFEEIEQGTAIGMGLATAVNRLKESPAKSRIIILMTDGVNNAGAVKPITAASLAAQYGIKVYTIAIGTNGNALFPVGYNYDGSLFYDWSPVEIDEDLLKEIAQETGGKYFRATDSKKLQEIYQEIDKLEKSKNEEIVYYNHQELYRYLIVVALLFLVAEFLLKNIIFKGFV